MNPALMTAFFVMLVEEPGTPITVNPAVLIASLYVFALAAFLGYHGHLARTTLVAYAANVGDQRHLRYLARRYRWSSRARIKRISATILGFIAVFILPRSTWSAGS